MAVALTSCSCQVLKAADKRQALGVITEYASATAKLSRLCRDMKRRVSSASRDVQELQEIHKDETAQSREERLRKQKALVVSPFEVIVPLYGAAVLHSMTRSAPTLFHMRAPSADSYHQCLRSTSHITLRYQFHIKLLSQSHCSFTISAGSCLLERAGWQAFSILRKETCVNMFRTAFLSLSKYQDQ